MSKLPKSVNCIIPLGNTLIALAESSAIEKMGGRKIYSSYDQKDRSKTIQKNRTVKSKIKTRKSSD